jgi:Zn-dependent protease/predicted transcriptional regulator
MFRHAIRLPFKLLGIPILLDWTFIAVLPLLAWLIGRNVVAMADQFGIPDARLLGVGAWPWILGFISAVGLFVSVLIHELGHAMMAQGYGVRTRNITLWLLGGVAQLDRIPRKRGAEAVIAIIGPLVSMALGVLFWFGASATRPGLPGTWFVFQYLALLNWIIAGFNMIPAMPLDGGRVLRSLLAMKMPHIRATQVATGISRVLAIFLGLFGLLEFNFFLIAIAFFVYLAVEAEARNDQIFELLRGVGVRDLMTTPAKTVGSELTVAELQRRMLQDHHLGFPVIDSNQHLVGMVSLPNLQNASPTTPISEIMNTEPNTISRRASAMDAFGQMSTNNFGRLIVTDEEGEIAGILTKTDIMRALQLRGAGVGMPGPGEIPSGGGNERFEAKGESAYSGAASENFLP